MEHYQKYLDPRVLARLEGLRLTPRRTVEGYVAGVHHSADRGLSIEFAEHREYAPGDDLRRLDWKVFGRTDKYYLKQFEEETNLVCYVLLDTSRSMEYRSPGTAESKFDYARRLAACLSYVVLRKQDSVCLATFDDAVRAVVGPSGNPSHLADILAVMDSAMPKRKTAAAPVFHELAERFKRRGIVVVISDLLDNVDAMIGGLAHFHHRRHEVILLHVLDPAEVEFPFDETTLFDGLEDEPGVLVEPRSLRQAYLRQFDHYIRQLRQGCRMHQVEYAAMRTDQPLELALSAFLAGRIYGLRSVR